VRVPQWPLPAWMLPAQRLSDKELADSLRLRTMKLVDAGSMYALRYRDLNFDRMAESAIIIEAARRLANHSTYRGLVKTQLEAMRAQMDKQSAPQRIETP
jgi:hypothetical protein